MQNIQSILSSFVKMYKRIIYLHIMERCLLACKYATYILAFFEDLILNCRKWRTRMTNFSFCDFFFSIKGLFCIIFQLEFWLCLLLTILGYVPGMIYAVWVIVKVNPDGESREIYEPLAWDIILTFCWVCSQFYKLLVFPMFRLNMLVFD